MKKNSQVPGIVAFVAIIALSGAPLLAAPGNAMTTADLALRMARAGGITLTPFDSPGAALDALARAGIFLENDLETPVTEKVLLEVGAALGVKVTTSRPEAAVSTTVGSAFIASFKGALQSAIDPLHASCQGRQSRADRNGTPPSPSDPNATAEPCVDSAPRP
jgi:hypothetical protein